MEAQVRNLVDISGLSDPSLKKATIQYILKKGIKRPISKLVALVGHPCAQEQIEKINIDFPRKMKDVGDTTDPGTGKPLTAAIIDMMSHNAAVIIGEGFDIAFKDNLNINSVTGAVTVKRDSSGKPDDRFLKCAAAEVAIETPEPVAEKLAPKTIYKNPSDFREFLQKQSDPFKGSQQGVGRTRKQKRKQKKTLRRRKIRRNMH